MFSSEKAKEVIGKLRFHGCVVEDLSVSEDWRKPIRITARCREVVIDDVLREINDPHVLKKLLPDEFTPYPRWDIRKTRKIF